jgi:F420-non-reducing hydrogenase iron-sulfur subunit
VTAFVCANCAREGANAPAGSGRSKRPVIPWRPSVREVDVPCAGRLQPEHLLKAFECGADLVCVVACEEDNCHQVEGSCRASRRGDFVQALLREIGLGSERLMLVHLPGSAREDMAAAEGQLLGSIGNEELSRRVREITQQVAERLRSLPPNPMYKPLEAEDTEVLEAGDTEDNED